MGKIKPVRFTIIEVIIVSMVCSIMSVVITTARLRLREPRVQDWYPRLEWKDYKKEIHVRGNIDNIFVRDGILYVVSGTNIICYGALEAK